MPSKRFKKALAVVEANKSYTLNSRNINMIAVVTNKRIIGDQDFFDVFFFTDINMETQMETSLSGVIFDNPYSNTDIENRINEISQNLYPSEILTQIIIN